MAKCINVKLVTRENPEDRDKPIPVNGVLYFDTGFTAYIPASLYSIAEKQKENLTVTPYMNAYTVMVNEMVETDNTVTTRSYSEVEKTVEKSVPSYIRKKANYQPRYYTVIENDVEIHESQESVLKSWYLFEKILPKGTRLKRFKRGGDRIVLSNMLLEYKDPKTHRRIYKSKCQQLDIDPSAPLSDEAQNDILFGVGDFARNELGLPPLPKGNWDY